MPGIADLFYLGQADPRLALAQALGQGPGQPGGPPGPGGTPGGPPAPGGPQGAPGGAQGAPAPPQPQAYQSPPQMQQQYNQLAQPNIAELYMRASMRAQSEETINRGLAGIAASLSRSPNPADRALIANEFNGLNPDPAGQMGNVLSLYNMQLGMQARQQEMAAAPDIAAKTGMPLSYVQAEIAAGRGSELARGMEPPQTAKDYMWFRDQYVQQHQGDPGPDGKPIGADEARKQFEASPQGQLLAMGGSGVLAGMPSDTREMTIARMRFQTDPANAGKPVPGYLTDETKFHIYKTDLADAKSAFNGVNGALGNFIDNLGNVATDPDLAKVTGASDPVTAAKHALQAKIPGTPEYNMASKMGTLGGLAKALAVRGGPTGVGTNLKLLGANTDDFTNFGITNYGEDVLSPRIVQALTAQANAYAAAGRLKDMPGYLNKYVDPMYLPGGDFDISGGFKTTTPDKSKKQLTAQDLADFQNAVERYGPKAALKHLKDNGYDTSALE